VGWCGGVVGVFFFLVCVFFFSFPFGSPPIFSSIRLLSLLHPGPSIFFSFRTIVRATDFRVLCRAIPIKIVPRLSLLPVHCDDQVGGRTSTDSTTKGPLLPLTHWAPCRPASLGRSSPANQLLDDHAVLVSKTLDPDFKAARRVLFRSIAGRFARSPLLNCKADSRASGPVCWRWPCFMPITRM